MSNNIIRDVFVLYDSIKEPIEYVQGTNTLPILFHIRDYSIPEGTTARVYVRKPSTNAEYNEVSIDGDTVVIDVMDTMFDEVGKSFIQVLLINGDKTLVTFEHPVSVKKNHVAGEIPQSGNRSNFLDEYLGEIEDKIEITTRQAEDTAQAREDALIYSKNAETAAGNAATSENNAFKYANAASEDATSSANSAIAAADSEKNALTYSNNAATSERNSKLAEENSKKSEENALESADAAKTSENASAQHEANALQSAQNASKSETNSYRSESNTLQYSENALESANAAKTSEDATMGYMNIAVESATSAEQSRQASRKSADDSEESARQSAQSEANSLSYSESAKADAEQINSRIDLAVESAESALQSARNAEAKSIIADEKAGLAELYSIMAESFTHGGTGLRENEAVDNAQYFLEQVRQISQSMNGLAPIGTVTFEELALEENQVTKYMFNISNDFITDDTFKEGAGHSFPAGTNVFRTKDGYWDCLAGSFQTPNGDTKDNVTAFVPASTRVNIQSGEKHSVIFGKIAKFFADLKTVAFSGSYNDLLDKPSAGDVGAVATGGDVAENTVSYTEATALAELAPGEKLSVAFGKLKLAVKNVIAIAKLLGTTDISKIGDGTCTGAISAINTDLTQLNSEFEKFEIQTPGSNEVYLIAYPNVDNKNTYLRIGFNSNGVFMQKYENGAFSTLWSK